MPHPPLPREPKKPLPLRALRKLGRLLCRRDEVLLLRMAMREPVSRVGDRDGMRLHFITRTEDEHFGRLAAAFPKKASLFRRRLSQGVECGVIVHRGREIVAMDWFATRDFHEPTLAHTFHPAPGEIYQFDAHVIAAFRRSGLYSTLIACCWERYRARGFTHTTCGVDPKNGPSMMAHAAVGWEETGRKIVVRRVLGVRFSHEETYLPPLLPPPEDIRAFRTGADGRER